MKAWNRIKEWLDMQKELYNVNGEYMEYRDMYPYSMNHHDVEIKVNGETVKPVFFFNEMLHDRKTSRLVWVLLIDAYIFAFSLGPIFNLQDMILLIVLFVGCGLPALLVAGIWKHLGREFYLANKTDCDTLNKIKPIQRKDLVKKE